MYAEKVLHGWWYINIPFPGLLIYVVSRRGTCFHACATKCVKSVRRKTKHTLKGFEKMSVVLKCTDREDMVASQDDHMLYLLR